MLESYFEIKTHKVSSVIWDLFRIRLTLLRADYYCVSSVKNTGWVWLKNEKNEKLNCVESSLFVLYVIRSKYECKKKTWVRTTRTSGFVGIELFLESVYVL